VCDSLSDKLSHSPGIIKIMTVEKSLEKPAAKLAGIGCQRALFLAI